MGKGYILYAYFLLFFCFVYEVVYSQFLQTDICLLFTHEKKKDLCTFNILSCYFDYKGQRSISGFMCLLHVSVAQPL